MWFVGREFFQGMDLMIRNKKRGKFSRIILFCPIVRVIGLEPTRRKTPDPKSGASTNFATRATVYRCKDSI